MQSTKDRLTRQCARILAHLQAGGSLTAREALVEFGCLRLAARIKEIRDCGHQVQTEWVTDEGGARYARYRMGAAS